MNNNNGTEMMSMNTEGPVPLQAGVTWNIQYDGRELRNRQTNGSRVGKIYPGGANNENHKVSKGDVVMGYRRRGRPTVPHLAGVSSQSGWVSFNGKNYAQYDSREELEETFYVMGVSKTDHIPYDPDDIQNGLAIIAAGTTTVKYTGSKNAFPGDELVGRAPPLHSDPTEYRAPQYTGKPAGKLPLIVEPLDLRDIDQEQDMTYVTMMRQDSEGVGRRPFAELYAPQRTSKMSRRKEAALCMRMGATMTFLRGVESAQHRELVRVMTPERTEKERIKDELIVRLVELAGGGSNGLEGATIPGGDDPLLNSLRDAVAKYGAVQSTNPTLTRPTGMDFYESVPGLDIEELGPQLYEPHSYFAVGAHWARRFSNVGRGETLETVRRLKRERELSLLWLAHMHGATGLDETNNGTEKWAVVDDLQNHVHLSHAMLDTQTSFMPKFSADDDSTSGVVGRGNRMKNAYANFALNHAFEREYATGMHYHGTTSKVFAVSMGHARRDVRDEHVDALINSRKS